MATRIAAHFMHETELAAALAHLQDTEATDAFVIGTTDQQGIAELKARGLFVEVLEELPEPKPVRGLRGGPTRVAPTRKLVRPRSLPADVVVRLAGPLTPERRRAIEDGGARVRRKLDPGRLLVEVDVPAALDHLEGLDIVREMVPDEDPPRPEPAAASGQPEPARAAVRKRGGPRKKRSKKAAFRSAGPVDDDEPAETAQVVDFVAEEDGDLTRVVPWLGQHHPEASVVFASANKVRVLCTPTARAGINREFRRDVALDTEVRARALYNDKCRTIVRSDELEVPLAGDNLQLTGAGELIGIADSGLYDEHPDFEGRIAALVALGRPPDDTSDPHGHGTHVAGTAAGDGSGSRNGALRGVAPGARIYFQSIMDAAGGLGGLPDRMSELLQPPYDDGVRIHNNSWGIGLQGRYAVDALEVDRFVAANPDMLVVIAAGNDGSLHPVHVDRPQVERGFVEFRSMGSPATSKNGLVIGASRSTRTRGGYARFSHNELWPDSFPDLGVDGVATEKVSGDPESLAGFSSRGPTGDDRIKPDLVAPGTDVLSTRSKDAPGSSFWGTRSADANRYAYMGGTSMATPHVSGCAALVREFLREHFGYGEPSAALMKAILINGAHWLSGRDAMADHDREANFHQGFGRLDLAASLEVPLGRRLAYVDTWRDGGSALASGTRARWRFRVENPDQPLRVCLAYTDLPGKRLQNDLNLFLEGPGGVDTKWYGNQHVRRIDDDYDRVNNVEVIRIDEAPAGNYLVQISAWEVFADDQHYALVVGGELEHDDNAGAIPWHSAATIRPD